MKNKALFVCSNCGAQFNKWFGKCPSCSNWNTINEEEEIIVENSIFTKQSHTKILKLSDINLKSVTRISSGFKEVDRVLGGVDKNVGFVPSSVVLLSGEPGIGKSTLLLQVLDNISTSNLNTLYISAEESTSQIATRANRILNKNSLDNINILATGNLNEIFAHLRKFKPSFVILDSIQTVVDPNIKALAGGIAQVKSATVKLVEFAKQNKITIVIVGHINKDGNIAGPKVLEHLVDTVLHMEGDEKNDYRLLRSLKNRFGTTNEVGILGMDEKGLIDIKDASSFFVTSQSSEGVSRSAIIEGNRVIVVEVQALTTRTSFVQPKRVAQGISNSKLQLICAILQKHTNINLYDKDVYINIAGGLKVSDPGIDLAIAYSILSSVKEKKISANVAVLGELSLTGRIGQTLRSNLKEKELKKLGYTKIITPSKIKYISELLRN